LVSGVYTLFVMAQCSLPAALVHIGKGPDPDPELGLGENHVLPVSESRYNFGP
jgi:hypothetical protein